MGGSSVVLRHTSTAPRPENPGMARVVAQTFAGQAKTIVCVGVEQIGRTCGKVAPKIGPHTKRCADCQSIFEEWSAQKRQARRAGKGHR